MWESEDEAWSVDESASSGVSRENNVGDGALHVIGLYGPARKYMTPGSWILPEKPLKGKRKEAAF